MEDTLRSPEGIFVRPDDPDCAVLVLSGSSGRVEADRARMLASHGAAALSYRWFGDGDLPPGICEIPLESFTPYVDRLAELSDNLAIVGTSKGAEAALLLAAHDPRIRTVVAIAPTHVVWSNVGPGYDGETLPWRSSWTLDGKPLPFVPFDTTWTVPDEEPVVLEPGYTQSLRVAADQVPEATIPVERIRQPSSLTHPPAIAPSSPASPRSPAAAWPTAAPPKPTPPSASSPGPTSAPHSASGRNRRDPTLNHGLRRPCCQTGRFRL